MHMNVSYWCRVEWSRVRQKVPTHILALESPQLDEAAWLKGFPCVAYSSNNPDDYERTAGPSNRLR